MQFFRTGNEEGRKWEVFFNRALWAQMMVALIVDLVLLLLHCFFCHLFVAQTFYSSIVESLGPECNCVQFHETQGKEFGVFTSPDWPSEYENSIECLLYTFVAPPDKLIEVTFDEFDVQKTNLEWVSNCCWKVSTNVIFRLFSFSPEVAFMEISSNYSYTCPMDIHPFRNRTLGMMFCAEKLLISNKLITHPVLDSSLNFIPIGDPVTILDSVERSDSWVNVRTTLSTSPIQPTVHLRSLSSPSSIPSAHCIPPSSSLALL